MAANTAAGGIPSNDCSAMNSAGFTNPPYPAPPNVKVNQPPPAPPASIFCEEVYVNGAEKTFVTTNGLSTLTGQQTYGNAHGGAITFPWDAVEIKVDWVPTSSFNPSFQCPDPTGTLYTETINGTCYAMVGLHISSKVLPNWLWATFEPNSSVTNPNRCDPNLYDTCSDPWGTTSSTPYAEGPAGAAAENAQLQQAMTAAGAEQGVQQLLPHGRAERTRQQRPACAAGQFLRRVQARAWHPDRPRASPATPYAYFDGKAPPTSPGTPEDNFGGPPKGWSPSQYACNQRRTRATTCTPVVPNSTSQDFSWMLGLMPDK